RNSSPTRSPPCRYESSGLNPVGIPRNPFARPARTSPSSCSSTPRRLTIRCPCTLDCLDCPGTATPSTPFRPPNRGPRQPRNSPPPTHPQNCPPPTNQHPGPPVAPPLGGPVDPPAPRACSSAGERCLHTAEVTGSIPVTPTSTNALPNPQVDACCQQNCQQITESDEASHALTGG